MCQKQLNFTTLIELLQINTTWGKDELGYAPIFLLNVKVIAWLCIMGSSPATSCPVERPFIAALWLTTVYLGMRL